MTEKCNQENCPIPATVQIDHAGDLIKYCPVHWNKYQAIMDAMGSPIPISYPVGTKANE